MKSFQIVSIFAMVATTLAFAPNTAPKVLERVADHGIDFSKAALASIPAAIATPAFALDSVVENLPTQTLSLEVQFGAYLAVLLGTFFPVLFLINLYVQTESRKAGKAGGQDSE
eukprot:scaffold16708_cov34-Cyclotella_meneghiniana.AAC.2